MYVDICIYIYIYVYVHVYMCICICTYTHPSCISEDGLPIPWGSIAGLTGEEDGTLWAVEGEFFRFPQILNIDGGLVYSLEVKGSYNHAIIVRITPTEPGQLYSRGF